MAAVEINDRYIMFSKIVTAKGQRVEEREYIIGDTYFLRM
jgi:hypothetical protein